MKTLPIYLFWIQEILQEQIDEGLESIVGRDFIIAETQECIDTKVATIILVWEQNFTLPLKQGQKQKLVISSLT